MLFLNKYNFSHKVTLVIIVSLINLLAVVGGITFVVKIIDPNKYKIAAIKILSEGKDFQLSGNKVTTNNFTTVFDDIEKSIKEYFATKPEWEYQFLSTAYRNYSMLPIAQIAYFLWKENKIDKSLFVNLLNINKYHNLVVHGQVKVVDQKMVDEVIKLKNTLKDQFIKDTVPSSSST